MSAPTPDDPPDFYSPSQRDLQDAFDTRPLADRLELGIVRPTLDDAAQRFIAERDMFWLATVDVAGRPSVSYKGGAPGFVHVVDETTLRFGSYDGNGMFFSTGNIAETREVGLLFMDFATPQRLRVQGEAALSTRSEDLAAFPGAQLVVEIAVARAWVNCPRYVHTLVPKAASRFVPATDGSAPLPAWKRIEAVQDVLSPADRARAEREGLLDDAAYAELLARGET